MLIRQAWSRFTEQWQRFGLIGLNYALLLSVLLLMSAFVAFIWLGSSPEAGSRVLGSAARARDLEDLPAVMLALIKMFPGLVATLLSFGLPLCGFMRGALIGTVARLHQGEKVTFGDFWAMGERHLVPVTLVVLVEWPLSLAALGLMAIPAPSALTVLLVGFIQAFIKLYLGLYPAYLVLRDGLKVTEAFGYALRALSGRFGEAALAALMGFVFALVALPVHMASAIPFVGWAVVLAAYIFGIPLITYYFIVRFETNVRPDLS